VKSITAIGPHAAAGTKRGISGNLVETFLFFFKGQWPSRLPVRERAKFAGTTWDDSWGLLPQFSTTCSVPLVVKSLIMEDAWCDMLNPKGEQDEDEMVEDEDRWK
jgi:hypothetical protein